MATDVFKLLPENMFMVQAAENANFAESLPAIHWDAFTALIENTKPEIFKAL